MRQADTCCAGRLPFCIAETDTLNKTSQEKGGDLLGRGDGGGGNGSKQTHTGRQHSEETDFMQREVKQEAEARGERERGEETNGGGVTRGFGGALRKHTATSRDCRRLERRCSCTSTGSTQSKSRTKSNWAPGLVGSSSNACREPAANQVKLVMSFW